MPVRLFPDDSQQPDLSVSGESNFWHDGYSYRQDNREKGYTIIDRESTGTGANLLLPTFSSVVSMLFDPQLLHAEIDGWFTFVEALWNPAAGGHPSDL